MFHNIAGYDIDILGHMNTETANKHSGENTTPHAWIHIVKTLSFGKITLRQSYILWRPIRQLQFAALRTPSVD